MILNKILLNNAKGYPNKPATTMQVGFRNYTLTYKETYEMAQQVATLLEQQGINKGDPVLICAPNSPFWTSVFWGCMLKGAVVVPLNIQSTKDVIELIIKQTGAKVIFDYPGLKHNFDGLTHYNTNLLDEILANTKINFTAANVNENDLVQIMYTSGTTGAPKGVMLSHKNIFSNITAINEVIHPDPKKDKMLSILPLSHIYEQTIGFLLPYSHQVEIVYAHSHSAIRKLLREHQVTKMLAVPEFLQLFMNKIESGAEEKGRKKLFEKMMRLSLKVNQKWFARLLFRSIHKNLGGKLETIASGGAPLSVELEQKWNALGIDILQGYGLTETSPVVTTNTYHERRLGSIGKALSNVEIKLDKSGQIWVKGPNVFEGYYKNPEKTKEVLVDGWFNTEDIGEFDENGFLYMKGRKKYVIIGPGGQNVYPEDIEFEISKATGVKDSCVIGLEKSHGTMIHAVLILDEKKHLNPSVVIEEVNEKLTSYQHINSWSIWPQEDFPRTATRKVKKNEVTQVVESEDKSPGSDTPQVSHSKLVKILSQITSIPKDKIYETTKIVSDLNLDSLGRVELVGAIEEEMRITITEQDITPNTTVAELEKTIKSQKPTPEPPPLKRWPRMLLIKIIRVIPQAFFFALIRTVVKLKIEGLDNLKDLKYPVVFMPNHLSYADSIILAKALPFKIRWQLSFAAARDFLYEDLKFLAHFSELSFNSFPIQRAGDSNIKLGLEYIGKMLDSGYSVCVFPEGAVSKDGTLQPLKGGAGIIATNMFAQVVPVKIDNIHKVFPYEKIIPRSRATVTIKFGKPLKFNRSDSYEDTTKKIHEVLKKM